MASLAADYAEESKKQKSFNLFETDFWRRKKVDKSNPSPFAETFEVELSEDDGVHEEEQDPLQEVQQTKPQQEQGEESCGLMGWFGAVKTVAAQGAEDNHRGDSVQALVEKARKFQSAPRGGDAADTETTTVGTSESLARLQTEIKLVIAQIDKSFANDIDLKLFNPISFNYFLEKEESRKTPSWKRRRHRFMDELEEGTLYSLHDALYLSEVSYLDSAEDITEALQNYTGPSYELVYCCTEAFPREPAHYVAIKKTKKIKKAGLFHWKKENKLDVLMVVRGTKEISDILSDCLLESREYHGGSAHDGVCQSGMFLVEKHKDLFELLLEESGKESIRLSLIGHSLGAGAAAIACIEYNKKEGNNIEATCIGFGCPALVTKDISEEFRDKITTVVCDADCVPRMSGATVKNLIFEVMGNDWTHHAIDDVDDLINVFKTNLPFELPKDIHRDVHGWVQGHLHSKLKPDIEKVSKTRTPIELFPPGKCIHIYRDGVGVSVAYTNCNFFNEFDVCRTMIDDHLILSGYDHLFHELGRQQNDSRFFFRNDVAILRVEKHRRLPKEDDGSEKK